MGNVRSTGADGAKLLLSLAASMVGMAIPPTAWPAHGALLCLIWIALALSRARARDVWRRLLLFLPFLGLFALAVPLSQGFRGGWEIAAGIMFRGTESFLAGLWLIRVVPFERLLAVLARWRAPAILIAILAFMYRFLFVLWDELDRMRLARRARGFGRQSMPRVWLTHASMVGMLLIRALSRSERVHAAMCARGWDGTLHSLDELTP